MKVPVLCLAICCTILFFSVTFSESDPQNTTENTQKNVKAKRSSDELIEEKENGTKKIESAMKRREVSGDESSCENIIQNEEVVIENLLKTIETIREFLNNKSGLNQGNDYYDEDSYKAFKINDDFHKDNYWKEKGIEDEKMNFFNKGPYNHFNLINNPIGFPHENTTQFPIMPNFNIPGFRSFQTQTAKPNVGWRLVPVPRSVNINSAILGGRRAQFPNFPPPRPRPTLRPQSRNFGRNVDINSPMILGGRRAQFPNFPPPRPRQTLRPQSRNFGRNVDINSAILGGRRAQFPNLPRPRPTPQPQSRSVGNYPRFPQIRNPQKNSFARRFPLSQNAF